jgi:hypothetical protein
LLVDYASSVRIAALLAAIFFSFLVIGWTSLALPNALGQSELTTFEPLIARSNALVADGQADLPAYHIHYDIHAWDYHRNPSFATYDVYRDGGPKVLRSSRRGDFSESLLTLGSEIWVKRSAITPLRLTELTEAFPRPAYAYDWVQKSRERPMFRHRDQQGKTLVCGTTDSGLELCFDQASGLIASARIKDQIIRYGDWRPIGSRFVPGNIEMCLGDRLLFSARVNVDLLPMDESLFTVQPGAWQMGGPASIIRNSSTDSAPHSNLASPTAADPSLKKRPSNTVFMRLAAQCPTTEMPDQAGAAQVIFEVDKGGRVRKASIEDADSTEIASAAIKNARQCRYEPHVSDGRPTAFESFLVYVTPSLRPPSKK